VDVAEARKIIAVAEYERTIQIAFREVADQLSARQSLARQMQATTANTRAQERRLEIAQARFNVGLVGYLEVLDGQRELVAAQQGLGALIQSAGSFFQIDVIYVGIVCIGVVAMTMDMALRAVTRRMIRWQERVEAQ
jgi:outer membrane protein TolC